MSVKYYSIHLIICSSVPQKWQTSQYSWDMIHDCGGGQEAGQVYRHSGADHQEEARSHSGDR